MNNLLQLINKFQHFPAQDLVRETIAENQSIIEDKQIAQFEAGEYPDGNRIEPEYSDITVALKKMKGQVFDRVTLHDTGDFYRGIKLDLESDYFTLDSTDSKTDKIVEKYSDVFGLTDKSKQELIDDQFRPTMDSKIRQYLEV